MTYKIVELDINDERIIKQVNVLLGHTFGSNQIKNILEDGKLKRNTYTDGDNPSLYLAAIEKNEIIGFNAFISHTLYLNNKKINCYQSCWTATSEYHRGKKVFQSIIEYAKEILFIRGAGFIFGFPNENSHPIFTKKLGFKEIESLKINIPNIKLMLQFFFNRNALNISNLNKGSILQNDAELYNLKKETYGNKIIKLYFNESYIWGIIKSKIIRGFNLTFFEIGGIKINNTEDVLQLFKEVSKNYSFVFFQIVIPINNNYKKLFKNTKLANTNNLIVFDLNLNTSNYNFNFFGGIKDVY